MRKSWNLMVAAGMALGMAGVPAGSSVFAQQAEAEVRTEHDRELVPGERIEQRDYRTVSEREANNIRGTIMSATEAAFTERELRSMTQRLTSSDEARFQDATEERQEALDELVRQFHQAFEQRYDQEFLIREREDVYPEEVVLIYRGLTQQAIHARAGEEAAQLAGERMKKDHVRHERDHDRRVERDERDEARLVRDEQRDRAELRVDDERDRAELRIDREDRDREQRMERDRQRDEVRLERRGLEQANVATLVFPQADQLPEIHVPLVNEGTLIADAWRIDVPLHVDPYEAIGSLEHNLRTALERQEQWPEDVNGAYRMASHLVMVSLLDYPAEPEAQPAAFDGQQQQEQEQ